MGGRGVQRKQMRLKERRFAALYWLLGLMLIAVAAGGLLFGSQIRAVNSIKQLSGGLYYLEYSGDYGFSSFLEGGGAASDYEVAAYFSKFLTKGLYKIEPPEKIISGCSTIAVKNTGPGYLFGRNFDLHDCAGIIVKTRPKDGYASISTSTPYFLGLGSDFVPQGIVDKFTMLAAVYVPLDGMNEKGLCVAVNALDYHERTNQNTGKLPLTTTTAIRLLLDRAANVGEAVELLAQHDMHASADMEYHFAISDASGKSVVVEYIDNEMYVTELPVVTNKFLTPGRLYGIGEGDWDRRWEILNEKLAKAEGKMNVEQIKDALMSAAQSEGNVKTQWSIIYDQSALGMRYYHRRDFENYFSFEVTP